MRNLIISLVIFLMIPLLAACKKGYEWGPNDYEAVKQGEIFWANQFSKCGDAFFGTEPESDGMGNWVGVRIYQLKDAFILTINDMEGNPLTEADKLNGIQWKGKTLITCSAYRFYSKGKWSSWYDWWQPSTDCERTLVKIKDNWDFYPSHIERYRWFKAIACNEVPPG
jgi:hypothetical protein